MTYKPGCTCRPCRAASGRPTRVDRIRAAVSRSTSPVADDPVVDVVTIDLTDDRVPSTAS